MGEKGQDCPEVKQRRTQVLVTTFRPGLLSKIYAPRECRPLRNDTLPFSLCFTGPLGPWSVESPRSGQRGS